MTKEENLYLLLRDCGEWVTRDGQILHIKNMASSHINNCIKMLSKNNKTNNLIYWMLNKELQFRSLIFVVDNSFCNNIVEVLKEVKKNNPQSYWNEIEIVPSRFQQIYLSDDKERERLRTALKLLAEQNEQYKDSCAEKILESAEELGRRLNKLIVH